METSNKYIVPDIQYDKLPCITKHEILAITSQIIAASWYILLFI